MSEQRAELKRRILELLKEDKEFRYTVAGFLGLDEILVRLDRHEKILEDLLKEIRELRVGQEKLWIEVRRHSEAIEKLREDFNKMLDRIAKVGKDQRELRRSFRRMEGLHKEMRGEMHHGFSQLSKFAGVTFEEFVRGLLTQRFRESGFIPPEKELRAEMVGGEQINLFCEEPLIVGEVTAHAESVEEFYKLMRKVEAAEKAYGRKAKRKILIVLTAPRQVAGEIERLCEEHDVELVVGRVL